MANPHFFQPLLPGFTNHLDIPVAFFLNYVVGSNVGKMAELRSDASETTTWKVKVDGRRLSNGWEDFAVAHDLRVGDILVFRQEGELVFHVSALGPSCCEIQYREDNTEEDIMEKLCDTEKVSKKRKSLKREADYAPQHSLDISCFVATVTASNLKRDFVYIPREFAMSNSLMKKYQIVLMNEEGETWTIDLRQDEAKPRRFYMRKGWRSFCIANGKKPGDMFTFKLVQNEETPVLKLFPLNIEDLEKNEKLPRKKSLQVKAEYKLYSSCFVATVTSSNLSRDRLYLPKVFVMANGLSKKFRMVLMNEEGESWRIDVKHEAYSGRFLTIRGWKNFCVANGKKPGDLFIFKLVQNEDIPVLKLFPLNSQDLHKLETSNETRQEKCLKANKKEFLAIEATEREFLGAQVCRKDHLPFEEPINEDIRQGKCSQAIKQVYVSTEENGSTSQNQYVTLTLTPASKLNLPLEFTTRNGIDKPGKITMVDRYGARWRTSLLMDKRGTMSLGKGSKGFCEVNGVKMDESFVLELIWKDTVPLLNFSSKV